MLDISFSLRFFSSLVFLLKRRGENKEENISQNPFIFALSPRLTPAERTCSAVDTI